MLRTSEACFVLASQQTSVSYCRLTDFRALPDPAFWYLYGWSCQLSHITRLESDFPTLETNKIQWSSTFIRIFLFCDAFTWTSILSSRMNQEERYKSCYPQIEKDCSHHFFFHRRSFSHRLFHLAIWNLTMRHGSISFTTRLRLGVKS